jgi:hypothetical protein
MIEGRKGKRDIVVFRSATGAFVYLFGGVGLPNRSARQPHPIIYC